MNCMDDMTTSPLPVTPDSKTSAEIRVAIVALESEYTQARQAEKAAARVRQRAALDRVIACFPSIAALAEAVGVSYQTVQGWREDGVPLERCAQLETMVKGAVQCHQLNEEWTRVTDRPFGSKGGK